MPIDFLNQYLSCYIKIKQTNLIDNKVQYKEISGKPETTLGDNQKLLPTSWDDGEFDNPITDKNILKNGPSRYRYHCNKSGQGLWCAALIMQGGWKISADYPW